MGIGLEWVLVRHGRTQWNAERRYLGWADMKLLPGSEASLEPLAAELAEETYCAVYCSDLKRCRETLQRTRPDLLPVVHYDPRLRELDFGEWEGQTYAQLKDVPLYRKWIDEPERFTPPSGESWTCFLERVSAVCRDMAAGISDQGQERGNSEGVHPDEGCLNSGDTVPKVLVITHGGVIRLMSMILQPGTEFWEYGPETGHVLRIRSVVYS